MTIDPTAILQRHYPPGGKTRRILLEHSRCVARKAVAVASRLNRRQAVDIAFVEEAALLHDIGIKRTSAPDIDCHGDLPYLCHGLEGRKMLENLGLSRHALVCERHIGVGLTAAEILERNLSLPARDMVPVTIEEQIVTYADLFFSKNPGRCNKERSCEEVRQGIARYGPAQLNVFDRWHLRFACL